MYYITCLCVPYVVSTKYFLVSDIDRNDELCYGSAIVYLFVHSLQKIATVPICFSFKSGQKWSKYWSNISLIELIWPAIKSVSLFQQHALNLFLGVTQQFWCSSWQFESYFQNSIFLKISSCHELENFTKLLRDFSYFIIVFPKGLKLQLW